MKEIRKLEKLNPIVNQILEIIKKESLSYDEVQFILEMLEKISREHSSLDIDKVDLFCCKKNDSVEFGYIAGLMECD